MTQYKPLFILKNVIKTYAWGDRKMLPDLLQYENQANIPQAELWMGTHPNGTSFTEVNNTLISLQDLIQTDPQFFLGKDHISQYGEELPFLLKVLAIGTPLSLQVHPSKTHAEEGFYEENRHTNSPSTHENRIYKDNNHKRELLVAYNDEFWALCGFRSYTSIIEGLMPIASETLQQILHDLRVSPSSSSLQQFIYSLLSLSQEEKEEIIIKTMQVITSTSQSFTQQHPYFWIKKLWDIHPHDIAILAPLYMNIVHIPQNKAIFVDSGTIHSYLQGIGIEILTLSDNVIRFGLTPKPIDIASLRKIVRFEPIYPEILQMDISTHSFSTPCQEFLLSYQSINNTNPFILQSNNTAQIILALNGKAYIYTNRNKLYKILQQGQSIFVPHNAGSYCFRGESTLFIASTP
ncbi:mannose-6-phosphate isomerase, class I [Entomospira nematocerorum]|uniref:mannose-6-phosphate isomerase n=1 Tax=Entomospira nematocerorum TaxID=2719987 RepID=A0A968GGR2_9SPIO|nr:mannose-6-phosphate isomerase, class I [Entomospira nematocera]NIZ46836.1 mannose-6-phosphate isomerase, class I [Entomospira nematocera]WDI33366.1 mannose-6-phosphate isomerase, class I [Entomospira nematocera]